MAAEILDFPDGLSPSTMDISLESNTKVFESIFNKSTSTAKFAGDRWNMTLNFDNLDWEIDILSAFMFRIGGRSGRVRITPFHRAGGPSAGNPTVQGNINSGGVMQTDGWKSNKVVLRAGQFFQVRGELKMLIEDCVSDELGNATMKFVPWLRETPFNGDPIVTNKPTGVFRLVDDFVTMNLEPGNGTTTLEFTEAFYV